MSAEAVAWASDQLPPKGRAKELLRLLAAFADAEGVFWAAIGTLAEDMQLCDRQVQKLLRILIDGEFIFPTGRFHFRNIPYYQLALDRPGALASVRAARRAARRTPRANGELQDTVQKPNGELRDTVQKANGELGDARTVNCSSPNISRENLSGADAPSTGARACGEPELDADFEALFAAWADRRPGRVSRPRALAVWREASRRLAGERICAAGLRYLAEDESVRRLGPLELHRWLAEARWEPWLAAPERRAAATVARRAFDQADVRAALVQRAGVEFVATWLDPARWDADRRAILARTGVAAERLSRALPAAEWAAIGVEIIERGGTA